MKCLAWQVVIAVGLIVGWSSALLAADTITGVVRNQTRSRLAAGDEVILFRLDSFRSNSAVTGASMQEEARTTTDLQGSFALPVRHPDRVHLLRVIHAGVNYDQRISPGNAIVVDVFDAASHVRDITGTIEIIRTGINGNVFHVSDMIEIKNQSSPPLTQSGERTFEVYLPAEAKIDSILAAGSDRIGMQISASPAPGDPGHYTLNFPLRPGATQFAFNYDLPDAGHVTFRTKRAYPLQQLAVMIPLTMKFTSRDSAFQLLSTGSKNYRVEAASPVNAGDGPEFEISGPAPLPASQTPAASQPKSQIAARITPALSAPVPSAARAHTADAAGIVPVSFGRSQWPWWALGASACLILGGSGFLWRKKAMTASAVRESGRLSASRVNSLKEQLFQLEIDRLRGIISPEEYDSARLVLDQTVERAIAPNDTSHASSRVNFLTSPIAIHPASVGCRSDLQP